jgi:hypothetical protein
MTSEQGFVPSSAFLDFTAHNILLPNGARTVSDQDALLSDLPQYRAILRTLHAFFRREDKPKVFIWIGIEKGSTRRYQNQHLTRIVLPKFPKLMQVMESL